MTTAPPSDSIEPDDYDGTQAGFHERAATRALRRAASYRSYLDCSVDPGEREYVERMAAARTAEAEAHATYAAVLRQRQAATA